MPHYISAVNHAILDIFTVSILHQNVFMTTEKRWYMAENAYTTEGQTCGIAQYTTLIVRGTMFDSLYVGR